MTATGLMVLHHKKIISLDANAEDYMKPLKFKAYEGRAADVKSHGGLRDILRSWLGRREYKER